MKPLLRLSLAAALLCAGVAHAGTATVTFIHPDKFADLPFSPTDREDVLNQVSEHFKTLAAKLPEGQELKVEVVDLDLAGSSKPFVRGTSGELRVLKGAADWPVMTMRYQIVQDGKVIKSGEETVKDMDYMGSLNRYSTGDVLRYEKAMLDSWFKHLVAAR